MPDRIERDVVERLVSERAQLVEVLAEREFRRLHLAGALSLPLRELRSRAPARLDPARPIVVYCQDFL